MRVNVTGGTNAGWRLVAAAKTEPWTCSCGHVNKPNYRTCFGTACGRKRP